MPTRLPRTFYWHL